MATPLARCSRRAGQDPFLFCVKLAPRDAWPPPPLGYDVCVMIDDLPKAVLAVFLTLLVVTGVWTWRDRRSLAAAAVRRLWRPPARRWLVVLAAIIIFAAVAEDAVHRERREALLQIDQDARVLLKTDAAALGPVAKTISRITGPWLAPAILAAMLILALTGRRREALVVGLGTLSSWAMAGILKVTLGVPRPRAGLVDGVYTSFGFPSGHTLVTLVACGLLAWAFARHASSTWRAAALAATVFATAATGISRVVLDAHWLSDVLGSFAFGVVWLNLVIRLGEHAMGVAPGHRVLGRRSDAAFVSQAATPESPPSGGAPT